MKIKRFIFLLIFALLPTWAFATGTCVMADNPNLGVTVDDTAGTASWGWIRDAGGIIVGKWITVKCTHSGTDNLSAAFPSTDTASADSLMKHLRGMYVYRIKSWPGSPAPDDGANLELTDNDDLSLLGSNGTAFLDSTSTLQTMGRNSFLGLPDYLFASAGDVWTATTNSTNSGGIFWLKFILLFEKFSK